MGGTRFNYATRAIAAALIVATALSLSGAASAETTSVYGWGSTGCCVKNFTPVLVSGIPNPVVQIVTSNSATYALDSSGDVWAWGQDSDGQLGDGTLTQFVSTPVQVEFPAGVVIAWLPNPMPYNTGLAVSTDNKVFGWGANSYKPLCLLAKNIELPVQLPFSDVTLASGAGGHALYEANGQVLACGDNSFGDLGNGTTTPTRTTPVAVVGLPDEPVRSLDSAWGNSGALMADGTFYAWGYNASGQLGNGTTTNSSVPVLVSLDAAATSVYQGGSLSDNGQTVAMLADGTVWAWGNNTWGQLGDGNRVDSSVPVEVEVPGGVTFSQVASGGGTSYAIDSTGDVWSWGQNSQGQAGSGAGGRVDRDTPGSIGLDLTAIVATAGNVAGIDSSAPSART